MHAGGVDVGYRIVDLKTRSRRRTGRRRDRQAVRVDGGPRRRSPCYSYRLTGDDHGRGGKPVPGATVVTRTRDRDFWTFSEPSNANGHYVSFFSASDEAGSRPGRSLRSRSPSGNDSYGSGVRDVSFSGCTARGWTCDCRRPVRAARPEPTPEEGAVYEGMLVGASATGWRRSSRSQPAGRQEMGAFRCCCPRVPRQDRAVVGKRLRIVLALSGRHRAAQSISAAGRPSSRHASHATSHSSQSAVEAGSPGLSHLKLPG